MDQLKQFDIASTVTDSLIEVFDTMLSMDLSLSDDESLSMPEGGQIVGSVSLAGKVKGIILIEMSDEFARTITASMQGVKSDGIDVENDVKDVISELCNIVGGNLKSNFCDAGLTCEISPPSFTFGSNFDIESLNISRHERYVFAYEKNPVIVEVGVRVSDTEEEEDTKKESRPITPEEVKRFELKTTITDSVIEVFDTMLSMAIQPYEGDIDAVLDGNRVAGSVDLVGRLMGSINILISNEFLRKMTASMLGIDVEEVEGGDDVRDVIGELCNIVGGNLKSKLCDAGFSCVLSTPSFTSGNDFTIENQKMLNYERLVFSHEEEKIYIEAGIKIAEESESKHEEEEGSSDTNIPDSVISQDDIDAILQAQAASSAADQEAGDTNDGNENSDKTSTEEDSDSTQIKESHLERIYDIPLELTVELGRTRKAISELLKIGKGSVVEFASIEGEPVDIRVNKILIARGEVIVEKEKYGVRIIETVG